MSFPLAFVHCCDGLPGDSVIVKGIDVEPSVSVTDAKDMPISLVQAQVAGSVVEVNVLMLLVGSVLV